MKIIKKTYFSLIICVSWRTYWISHLGLHMLATVWVNICYPTLLYYLHHKIKVKLSEYMKINIKIKVLNINAHSKTTFCKKKTQMNLIFITHDLRPRYGNKPSANWHSKQIGLYIYGQFTYRRVYWNSERPNRVHPCAHVYKFLANTPARM